MPCDSIYPWNPALDVDVSDCTCFFHGGRTSQGPFLFASAGATSLNSASMSVSYTLACLSRTRQYGAPTDKVCKETAPSVFTREWSKATVTVDCDKFTSAIKIKNSV